MWYGKINLSKSGGIAMKNIEDTVRSLGIIRTYKGYRQLCCVLRISTGNPQTLQTIRKSIYKEAAHELGCSWTSIERNIRTLSERAWKVNPSTLSEIVGFRLETRPSATVFLESLTYYILGDE